MEHNEIHKEVVRFLNKNYHIVEGFYFNRDDEQEWGLFVIETLVKVFGYEVYLTEEIFKEWVFSKGSSEEDYAKAVGSKRLKATWKTETANGLRRYGIDSAEEQLINILSEELAREIDAQILLDLKGKIKTESEFFGVMECVGYEITPPIYDPTTFEPKRGFISMKYNGIKHARDNNTLWKDWVRTRGLHSET
jgi:hypothetical protein